MKNRDTIFTRLYHGILIENPTVVLCLGLCPTLAVTTTARNGLAMGIVTGIVLVLSEFCISLLKRVIPRRERMIVYVLITACFTTLTQMALEVWYPAISESLGIFVSLTAVNGVIFGRADTYALRNNPGLSLFDGIGFGIGYTLIITVLGAVKFWESEPFRLSCHSADTLSITTCREHFSAGMLHRHCK